jgi:pimeloyl-[acyl-carrier protein] methyl ester esterase
MPYCTLNDGTKLYYESSGKGKLLLFIHGWSFNSRIWKGQIDHLKDQFQVLVVDLRGHGASEMGKENLSVQQFASDLDQIIKRLELENVNIVGWSMGGFVAIRLFFLCPERLSSLILVSTTPSLIQRDGFPHALPLAVVKRLKGQVKKYPLKALQDFRNMILSGEEEALENINEIREVLNQGLDVSQKTAEDSLSSLMEEDLREQSYKISLPSLIIHGDKDQICLPEAAFYLKERLKISRLLLLKGCGHASFLTYSLKFHEGLIQFLHSL